MDSSYWLCILYLMVVWIGAIIFIKKINDNCKKEIEKVKKECAGIIKTNEEIMNCLMLK